MTDFYASLYTPENQEERERIYRLMIVVGKLAKDPRKAPKIKITAEQAREVIRQCPMNKAAAIDGLPSNVYKHLTFAAHHVMIADQFTHILSSPREPCEKRPQDWNHASVSLLPKHARAATLSEFRPIALICQSQKIWERTQELLLMRPQQDWMEHSTISNMASAEGDNVQNL